jgi:NADP-dependent 3-hydroxy acid dehydrogenase YdfG
MTDTQGTETRIAVITGASRGIGRAIALRFARDGYEIVAVARKRAELDALCDEIDRTDALCRAIVLDVSDAAAVARELNGIDADVLVNNAGVGVTKPFAELSPDEWHRMVDVNVNALYHVTRAVLPSMIARRRGHVCTIGSIASRSAFLGGSCYAGTKAFVTAWAESLMLEVREHGVKVSVVMPGAVATAFNDNRLTEKDQWKLMPEDVADTVASVVNTPPHVLLHRVEVRTNNPPPAKTGGRPR